MRRMEIWTALCALALGLVLLLGLGAGRAVQTGSWGLSFPDGGSVPQAPESAEKLAGLDAAYLDTSGEKVVYLTFDAGYENGFTASILDTLRQHGVPAAFFLVGHYLESEPDLVRRMVTEGHTVGNHTVNHPDMSAISDPEVFTRELTGLEDQFQALTGQALPKFYRPPQGLYSRENLEMAQSLGYKTVFWSLAHADWDNQNQPDPDAAIEKLTSRLHPGAIVLLHSTSKTNAEILDDLILRWKEMGYRFAGLDELFSEK